MVAWNFSRYLPAVWISQKSRYLPAVDIKEAALPVNITQEQSVVCHKNKNYEDVVVDITSTHITYKAIS